MKALMLAVLLALAGASVAATSLESDLLDAPVWPTVKSEVPPARPKPPPMQFDDRTSPDVSHVADGFAVPLTSGVTRVAGLPQLAVNGRVFQWNWGATRMDKRPDHRPLVNPEAKANVVTVHANFRQVWPKMRKDGTVEFDPAACDRVAKLYAESNPGAYFMWDLSCFVPHGFSDLYPDEMCRNEKGEVNRDGRIDACVSYSSPHARETLKQMISLAIRYLESSPYANRIVGYRVTGGHTIEWLGWDSVPDKSLMLDFSPAERSGFEAWARPRFPNLTDFSIPTRAEREAVDSPETILWEPAAHEKVVAYHRYLSESVCDFVIDLCRAAKAELAGRKLVGTYYGYSMTLPASGYSQMRGHYALKRLLDARCVDFIMSPQPYRVRNLGDPFGDMKPFATMQAAGVVPVIEDDTRTHLSGWNAGYCQAVTREQSENVWRRNLATALCRLTPFYHYALPTGVDFDYEGFGTTMRLATAVGDKLLSKGAPRAAQVALIVSERSVTDEARFRTWAQSGEKYQTYCCDGSVATKRYGSTLFWNESLEHGYVRWSQSGAPVDYLLAEDLADHPGDYRLYVFLNPFVFDEKLKQAVEKLRTRDCTILWMYAPGYTKDGRNSLANMQELTGVGFGKLATNAVAQVTLADGRKMGTPDVTCGPLFYVKDPDVTLGTYAGGEAGAAIKRTGTATTVFCGAWQTDVPFIRDILKRAGVHVYTESNDPVEANGRLFALHARFPGVKDVKLPQKTDVLDVYNRRIVARRTDSFSFSAPLHSSWLFYCGDDAEAVLAARAPAQKHDPRYADRLYRDLVPHPDRVSRSGWLWNAERPVADGAESFFRLRFALEDEVRSASLNAYFDDSGAVFVNGTPLGWAKETATVDAATLRKQLRRGENVLALRVKNGKDAGGVIFLLEVELADGTRRYFHSDETVKASPVSASGWEQPGFDDSAWGGVAFQADAKGAPWSRARWAQNGFLDRFLTPDERTRYEREEKAVLMLPEGIDYGPAPDAKIVYVHNLPKISLKGRLYDPQWKMAGAADEWEASSFRRLGDYGIEFVMANVSSSSFETAPGQYDFSCFERESVGALRANPNAKLMFGPRLLLEKWLEANPSEAIAYAAGPVVKNSNEHRGRPFRPSAASRAYRQAACDCLVQLSEWIKTRPWANRVVMIRPCWGIYQEWHTYGMWDGPDVSQPMAEAFRRYKGGKWAKAEPPTLAERTTGGFMYDPVKDEKCIDFFFCQQEEVADLAAAFARTIKTHLPGRLVGMWYGYVFTAQAPEGANVLLDRMLSNPDIDYLCDIATYQPKTRWAGGAYMHRTIPATFHRYGKMCVLEDDNRYDWLAGLDPQHASLYMRSPRESVVTAERNYLSRLFDRCGIQYTDPIRGHGQRPFIIDNDTVLKGIANAQRVFRELETRVPADTGLDTAIVVDYRERFYWEAQTGKARKCKTGFDLYEYAPIALYRAGTDFDVLSLDDYLATPKRYAKVVAFNLFHTPEAQRTAFVAKSGRDRAAVVKIAVPGSPSADLGKDVGVIDTIPVTGAAWADVFRRLGTHLYTAPENCFRRNGELMMFCTADAGRHVITLPSQESGRRYRDYLSGKTYEAPVLEIECDGPTTCLLAPL